MRRARNVNKNIWTCTLQLILPVGCLKGLFLGQLYFHIICFLQILVGCSAFLRLSCLFNRSLWAESDVSEQRNTLAFPFPASEHHSKWADLHHRVCAGAWMLSISKSFAVLSLSTGLSHNQIQNSLFKFQWETAQACSGKPACMMWIFSLKAKMVCFCAVLSWGLWLEGSRTSPCCPVFCYETEFSLSSPCCTASLWQYQQFVGRNIKISETVIFLPLYQHKDLNYHF